MDTIKVQIFGCFNQITLDALCNFNFGLGPKCKAEVEYVESWGSGEVVLVFTNKPVDQKTRIIFKRQIQELIPRVAIHFIVTQANPQ